jgi:hypothetical protein
MPLCRDLIAAATTPLTAAAQISPLCRHAAAAAYARSSPPADIFLPRYVAADTPRR